MTDGGAAPRLALIGTGRMARRYHLPCLQYLTRKGHCQLVGVCDVEAERARRAARAFATAPFDDVRRLVIEAAPDAIVVSVPVAATAAVCGPLLRSGRPLLIEKPPGASARECRALSALARRSGARSLVAFNRRFCPVIVDARARVTRAGAITGASALLLRHRRTEPRFFLETGIHALDTLRFLGGDIARVLTTVRKFEGNAARSWQLEVEFRSGGLGTLVVRPEAGVQVERYQVFGRDRTAFVDAGIDWLADAPGRGELFVRNQRRAIVPPDAGRETPAPPAEAVMGGFYGEHVAFLKMLRSGAEGDPSLEACVLLMEMAEAIESGRSWPARRTLIRESR
jgi:predicted dehydrogenase